MIIRGTSFINTGVALTPMAPDGMRGPYIGNNNLRDLSAKMTFHTVRPFN